MTKHSSMGGRIDTNHDGRFRKLCTPRQNIDEIPGEQKKFWLTIGLAAWVGLFSANAIAGGDDFAEWNVKGEVAPETLQVKSEFKELERSVVSPAIGAPLKTKKYTKVSLKVHPRSTR